MSSNQQGPQRLRTCLRQPTAGSSNPEQPGRPRGATLPSNTALPSGVTRSAQKAPFDGEALNPPIPSHAKWSHRVSDPNPLPHPLPIALQRLKEGDMESFKLARACGQTPDPMRISSSDHGHSMLGRDPMVSGSKLYQLNGQGPFDHKDPQTLNRASSLKSRPSSPKPRPPPPFIQRQDPVDLLSRLNSMLKRFKSILSTPHSTSTSAPPATDQSTTPQTSWEPSDKIDIDRLMCEHHLDRQIADLRAMAEREKDGCAFEEREARGRPMVWRRPMCLKDIRDPKQRVLGQSLSSTRTYASCVASMADYQLDLPVLVYACVEELYRTGMTIPGLFRSPPDRTRHSQLIELFDHGPSFGRGQTLAKEATADVCALLRSYIDRLPEPILTLTVYDAFWTWCVIPSVQRKKNRIEGWDRAEMFCAFITALGVCDPKDFELETPQIDIARILLQMLPAANLSLLAYLCAFFTQIPLSPQNQLEFEDIARFFAVPLLGMDKQSAVKKEEARIMLVWILRRWSRISVGIFERAEGAGLGVVEGSSGSGSDLSTSSWTMDVSPRSLSRGPSPSSSDSDSVYSLPSIYASATSFIMEQSLDHPSYGDMSKGIGDGSGQCTESMMEWRKAMEADIEQLKKQLEDLSLRIPMATR